MTICIREAIRADSLSSAIIIMQRVTGMLEGKCPKCGRQFYGWALLQPRNQSCPKCGVGLLITENGKTFFRGYSPFDADKISIDSPENIDVSETKDNWWTLDHKYLRYD